MSKLPTFLINLVMPADDIRVTFMKLALTSAVKLEATVLQNMPHVHVQRKNLIFPPQSIAGVHPRSVHVV
jgi:hypothetical protein